MKIGIVGHPGSGKSYLADSLSKQCGLKIVDIDVLFDKHPLYYFSKKLYARALGKLLDNEADWVIDGYHGRLMPDSLWQAVDLLIYLDIPKSELKQNVLARYKSKKVAKEFSHWQSKRINNLKNYWQISYRDRALKTHITTIRSHLANDSKYIVLNNRHDIQRFLISFKRHSTR